MNKKLAKRIKGLEAKISELGQAIQDIRNSCLCLAPLPDEPIPNCEPPCSKCGQENCWCDEEPEEEVIYD